ncbi:MAG: hypothetical protein PHF83_05790 [Candidatus Methanomethylophilus sp.]|nr:hypothetical protein [Methanomethylophilus sp.]MDD4669053.1 hypothetical protein [Methanomethylophilus sp.]
MPSVLKISCFGLKNDIRTEEYGTDDFLINGMLTGRIAGGPEQHNQRGRAAGF